MKYRLFIIVLITIGLISYISASEKSALEEQIKDSVTDYYVRLFSSKLENIRITFLRLPALNLSDKQIYTIQVSDTRNKKKLGYHTIWVKILQNGKLVKKSPVSIQVEMKCTIVKTNQKIKRKAIMKAAMLKTEQQFIDSNLNSIVNNPEQIHGLSAQRMIKSGEILTKNLFEQPAVVQRGERLKLEIHTNSIVISTDCLAKGDGAIGDKIPVISEPSGKRMLATIKEHGLAIVRQEN